MSTFNVDIPNGVILCHKVLKKNKAKLLNFQVEEKKNILLNMILVILHSFICIDRCSIIYI